MDTVDVNTAAPWQLMVLLDLSREEVERLLLARPFATEESFHRALPARLAASPPGLQLPKLDINRQSAEQLVRVTGLQLPVAQSIVAHQPYYFLRQLVRAAGEDAYIRLLAPIVDVPGLAFTDKLTGRKVRLMADESRVLVSRKEAEGAEPVAKTLGLKQLHAQAQGSVYQVFSVPEMESSEDTLEELKRLSGGTVLPAFRDERSAYRYLNPAYCSIQFAEGIPEEDQRRILSELRLEAQEFHRTPGLVTARIPQAKVDPGAMARALEALNARPEVKFAEPNYLGFDDRESPLARRVVPSEAEGGTGIPWNLSMVRVPEAWARGRGSPDVVVAVVDSGVDASHPALRGTLLDRGDDTWNFTDDGQPEPVDEDGHGTFIAGLLVGNGANGVQGICPGCRLLPLKVPLHGEVNSYARRRDAILYALEKVPPGKRLILNLSWKTSGDVGLIRDAVNMAVARGAVVVASAGNEPERENEPHYPSDYPSVISVAAVGPDQSRASYSYFGDQVDISAPGGEPKRSASAIFSAALGGGLVEGYGTSFAAPHVAGVAALLLSANPSGTPAQVRLALETSAMALASRGMGRGLLVASTALNAVSGVKTPTQTPSSPQPALATGGDGLRSINGDDAETLASRYGLLPFTARLIVARRPYTQLEQLRAISGLSDAQYSAIAATKGTLPTSTAPLPASGASERLQAINTDSAERLASRFGLLPFTARIIVARRPYSRLEQLRGISGLTDAQYAAIAAG